MVAFDLQKFFRFALCLGLGQHQDGCARNDTSLKLSKTFSSDNFAEGFENAWIAGSPENGNGNGKAHGRQFSAVLEGYEAPFRVSINTENVLHRVDRRFLSTGVGTGRLTCDVKNIFPFNSTSVRTLARGLSPAVFRVGGKHADETVFSPEQTCSNISVGASDIFNSKVLTATAWKDLHTFATSTGLDVSYALNLCLRNGSVWNSTNARQLLQHNSKLGYEVIWQLGNEPLLFRKNYNISLTARQISQDFLTLRGLLSQRQYRDAGLLVGPDLEKLHLHSRLSDDVAAQASKNVTAYYERFLRRAGSAINATTVHFYNIHHDNTTSVSDFLDPDILDRTRIELSKYRDAVHEAMPEAPLDRWLGETSSVTSGGLRNASSRFVAGFLLLNNLGLAAKMNIGIFTYWNIFGNFYSLITMDERPAALYWVCLLHKRLVGQKVLSLALDTDADVKGASDRQRYVRVFAHCTSDASSYEAGSLTIIAMNMMNDTTAVLRLMGDLARKNVDEYVLTPQGGDLTAQYVQLNGETLEMIDNRTLPKTLPRPLPAGSNITLQPLTYGFYVIRDASAAACNGKAAGLGPSYEVI
ncbi:heparanase-like [Diadema setosum]|uniref:heparanase-like n=1 Tax=Diadema setosum TaxID=31175 RepID=UPI003B3B950C